MKEYLDELKNKYGYDENLLKAIEIVINMMIEQYGVQEQSEIFSLFAGTEIFAITNVNKNTISEIEENHKGCNPHIKYAEYDDPYGTDAVSSIYNFEPVFSGDMKAIDEVRFIVVRDMSGTIFADGYYKLFGTTIDIPYFLHEANHAYAMMHPEYIYDGKKILSKHGMCTIAYEYKEDVDNKYLVESVHGKDVILEEIINEKITQDMLCKFFKKDSYKQVNDLLNGINHVPSAYSTLLIAVADKLISLLGSDTIMDYRKNNNYDAIVKFNEAVRKSEIALEYLNDKVPFDYLIEKIHELFILNIEKFKIGIDAYSFESAKLFPETLAPLFAYEEVENKTMDLEKFNKKRDDVLGKYSQYKGTNLAC